ncbi:MAG TPA: C4-type zinc ribbon domain-containing protein [Acidobacteriaceae bacterium]|nr:C4-type zinc ribbon domain-containing protein [Acidobacteriaceae bacterium]
MHPDLAQLIDLQAHDDQMRGLRDQIAALAKDLARAESRAKDAAGRRAQVLDAIAREEALRRNEESEIADLREKLARTQKKLDMTTTTAQLTALEHEAAFARSEISRIEDAELESMERSENLDRDRAAAEAELADATAALDRERTRTTELTAADRTDLARLEAERTELRAATAQSPTGETSLSAYDRIAHAKGSAIAQAIDQQCSACRMMVRPQRWNDIRDNSPDSPTATTIPTCESCGRMLYYDPARDAPQRKAPQSESMPESKPESIAASIVRNSI